MKLVCLLLFLAMAAANAEAQSHGYRAHPGVEEKARLLQDNNQETYRALADEIFNAAHGFEILAAAYGIHPSKIPAPLDGVIKDRLVYAEMHYRQGLGKPVTEQQIVNLTNMLAKEFDLPAYTYTNLEQVRHMRMALLYHNPVFMGYGTVRSDMKVGESINEGLSPLQATHLLLEVMGHKISDPTFQIAPAEWGKHMERQKASQQEALKRAGGAAAYKMVTMDGSKTDEVRTMIAKHVSDMGLMEAYSLLENGFGALGVGK